jgi:hypothetical protein
MCNLATHSLINGLFKTKFSHFARADCKFDYAGGFLKAARTKTEFTIVTFGHIWSSRMVNFQSPGFPHNFVKKKKNSLAPKNLAISTRLDVGYNLC